MALDSPRVGYVVRETDDKVLIFGDYNYRFDVPKLGIKEVGRNLILKYLVQLAYVRRIFS